MSGKYEIGSLFFLVLVCSAASAVTLGQQDDFSASLNNWQRGTVALGGPGGAADGYLALESDGVGSTSRLVTFNQNQWTGDYLAAGVDAISLSLKNLGATDLNVRLVFGDGFAPLSGGTWYATSQSVFLPSASDWISAVLDVGPGDLQLVLGSASYTSVMQNVVTLRILHATSPSPIGDTLVGMLGVDRVVAVPEMGTTPVLLAGLAALAARRRWRGIGPRTQT